MSEERECQRCGHTCIAAVTGKTSDLFGFRWPGGKEHVGYVLPHKLIGLREGDASNDYMNFSYCLVCGQIQGKWPAGGAHKYLKEHAEPRYFKAAYAVSEKEPVELYFKAPLVDMVHAEMEARGHRMHTVIDLLKEPEGVEVIEL